MNLPFSIKFVQYFQALPLIEKGISRLIDIIGGENNIKGTNLENPFGALCEAIVFDEAFKIPFFNILAEWTNENVESIFRVIRKSEYTDLPQLSYFDTDCLFYSLDYDTVNALLSDSRLSSVAYNYLFEANKRYFDKPAYSDLKSDEMVITPDVGKDIDDKWFRDLWLLRYILYGLNKNEPIHTDKHLYENRWLRNLGFGDYFLNFTPQAERLFINNTQDWFSGLRPVTNKEPNPQDANNDASIQRRRRRRHISSGGIVLDVENEAIVHALSSDWINSGRFYDKCSENLEYDMEEWFLPCVDYARNNAMCLVKEFLKKNRKSNHDCRLSLVPDYSNVNRKTMKPGWKLGTVEDASCEAELLKNERYDVDITRYLDTLEQYNPFEIECYEDYIVRSADAMVKIFKIIDPILDADTRNVFSYIIDRCGYTSQIKKNLSKINRITNPVSYIDPVIENFVRDFIEANLNISSTGRAFIEGMIPNLCKFLVRDKSSVTPRAFLRLFYPLINKRNPSGQSSDLLRPDIIEWNTFPETFDDAYNKLIINCPYYPSSIKGFAHETIKSYVNRPDRQVAHLRKVSEDLEGAWIKDWINNMWSENAIKRFNTIQRHNE